MAPRRVRRADDARWEEVDGRVVLVVPKFGAAGTRLLRLFRLSPTARLRLDAMGSAAWVACDGRTVGDVLGDLRTRFPGEHDLERRLGLFVSQLVDRGLLVLED